MITQFLYNNSMNQIDFRLATPDDAEALLAIYKPYVEKTAITFEYDVPAPEEFRSRISNTLKKYPYIVALADGEIAGYAYASPFKSRAAYGWDVETSIYLDSSRRGQGIGKALLLKLEELLKKQNVTNVNACITYAVVEDQYITNASKRFHEKMGYSFVGEFHQCGYKFNRWYNMIWMEKIIGDHLEKQPPFIPFSSVMFE